MRRTSIKPGAKSLERGSTFSAERKPLKRTATTKRRPISPASPAQRRKARGSACIVTGALAIEGATVDPAHLCSRAHGGCDNPLCVVPLRRDVHESFDRGELDLLPYLRPHHSPTLYLPEIQHALGHYDGNLLGLLRRLTGDRYEVAG